MLETGVRSDTDIEIVWPAEEATDGHYFTLVTHRSPDGDPRISLVTTGRVPSIDDYGELTALIPEGAEVVNLEPITQGQAVELMRSV